ncbi:unnamed protein product, partial [Mesorhabditis spiculigera]
MRFSKVEKLLWLCLLGNVSSALHCIQYHRNVDDFDGKSKKNTTCSGDMCWIYYNNHSSQIWSRDCMTGFNHADYCNSEPLTFNTKKQTATLARKALQSRDLSTNGYTCLWASPFQEVNTTMEDWATNSFPSWNMAELKSTTIEPDATERGTGFL